MTDVVPKPMVPIGGKPILWHIMSIYANYGFNDFVLALGYKSEVIKQYFLNYSNLSSDFTVDLSDGSLSFHDRKALAWRVTLVDTGQDTMTGGRLGRLRKHLEDRPFMLTYGDGVADVNISQLLDFHARSNKSATVTTVRPGARFGELDIVDGKVLSFQEKPQTQQGWINGGFFVFENSVLDLIEDDKTVLEREPLEQLASKKELAAYPHESFWQCMDTVRDRDYLNDLWNKGRAPWKVW
jgi:glucose-1-phosphate cytidylyltransferase